MQILLAPMEGLLDAPLRDILTRAGGVDRCVSEFIRVTERVLPERAFRRIMPELDHGGLTPAGVPVRGQLLGSDPGCMAGNAVRLAQLGSPGIDLNFGCPAKVVNRHGGGASLLQDPQDVYSVVRAVREAVPSHIVVSAKMRLGFHDDALAEDNARAIAEAGASELVVHGRTKAHGYRPPAYWERIAHVREAVSIPVVANGEIWTVDDAKRCLNESGCSAIMLGRGMVADPGLALAIRAELGWHACPGDAGRTWADWDALQPLLHRYWQLIQVRVVPKHQAGRMKQWLNFLRRRHPQAEEAYQALRTLNDSRQVSAWLMANIVQSAPGDASMAGGKVGDNHACAPLAA